MMKMMFGRSAAADGAAANRDKSRAEISLCMPGYSLRRVRRFSPPLRRVISVAHPLFDHETQGKQRDHLDQRDERVNREPRERARFGPAHGAGIETGPHDAVQLEMLPEDQAERGAE